MNKYNDIEIQTAQNLLEHGYKWIVRYEIGRLIALSKKPFKSNNLWTTTGNAVCVGRFVPIFQNIRSDDKEPVSLESIVHPQILDDVEKRYLSAVIRPFKGQVRSITKRSSMNSGREYIVITATVLMLFPEFDAGTMYKGMEIGRRYTPEELNL